MTTPDTPLTLIDPDAAPGQSAVLDTDGTVYQWAEPLEEESLVEVTTPRGDTTSELFASLIAMTNGAIFDVLLGEPPEGYVPLTPTVTAAYNPTQARVPANNPHGGEWMDTPGGVLDQAEAATRVQSIPRPSGPGVPSSHGMKEEWFKKFPVTELNPDGGPALTLTPAKGASSAFGKRYTREEKNSLLGYHSRFEYHAMRDAYLAGRPYYKGEASHDKSRVVQTGEMVYPHLASAIEKTRLGHSTVLHRGLDVPDDVYDRMSQPGAVHDRRFYISTTANPARAIPHGAGEAPVVGKSRPVPKPSVVLDILVPKGTRVMPGVKKQEEWILAPTVTLTTRRKYVDAAGVVHLVVDLEDT